jgi:EmrB/QacA subfamily drug resistance transporter
VLLAGLVIFTIGSALCGIAPSLGWLIAGRVLQGSGGAALAPGSLSVLAAAFTEPRQRTQVIGLWSGISGIGIAAGPLIGGTLIQVAGWQSIFFVNVPIGVLVLLVGLPLVAESRNPGARRLDIPGQVVAVAGLTALTYAVIEGQSDGWGSPLIVCLFVASALLLAALVAVEARSPEPMLPLDLFRSATFSVANLAALVVGFALLGTVFFVSQCFQGVEGYSALGSGVRTLPNTVGIFIMAPLAGRMAARLGPRVPVTLGALLAGTALLLLTRIDATTPYGAIWWNLAMTGTGFGLMLSPITAAVLGATPPNRAGLGSSVVSASRQIGSVFGVALLGALAVGQFATRLTGGLAGLGVPRAVSGKIAETAASSGASAGSVIAAMLRQARVAVSPSAVHGVVGHSFAQALHLGFAVTGVLLLATGVLVATRLRAAPAPRAATAGEEAREIADEVEFIGSEIG